MTLNLTSTIVAGNTALAGPDIHFDGHGYESGWDEGGIDSSDDAAQTAFPIDFGTHHPVVTTAYSCLTGNYEDGDKEDRNIAESFLAKGAAVYIGSTQHAYSQSRQIVTEFYDQWAAYPDRSVGYAWTKAERDQWSAHASDPAYPFTVWEFNIYGDPKFGAAKPPSGTSAQTALEAIPATASDEAPPFTLEIHVPDLSIRREGGMDLVEIPGGEVLTEPGRHHLARDGPQRVCPGDTVKVDLVVANSGALPSVEVQHLNATPGTDPEGNPVLTVNVQVVNTGTDALASGELRLSVSDAAGTVIDFSNYDLSCLPPSTPGDYTYTINLPGAASDGYQVVAQAKYNGVITAPVFAGVNLDFGDAPKVTLIPANTGRPLSCRRSCLRCSGLKPRSMPTLVMSSRSTPSICGYFRASRAKRATVWS